MECLSWNRKLFKVSIKLYIFENEGKGDGWNNYLIKFKDFQSDMTGLGHSHPLHLFLDLTPVFIFILNHLKYNIYLYKDIFSLLYFKEQLLWCVQISKNRKNIVFITIFNFPVVCFLLKIILSACLETDIVNFRGKKIIVVYIK